MLELESHIKLQTIVIPVSSLRAPNIIKMKEKRLLKDCSQWGSHLGPLDSKYDDLPIEPTSFSLLAKTIKA